MAEMQTSYRPNFATEQIFFIKVTQFITVKATKWVSFTDEKMLYMYVPINRKMSVQLSRKRIGHFRNFCLGFYLLPTS